jgi:hypothetical protein
VSRLLQIARALPWFAVLAAGFLIGTWRQESRGDRQLERIDAAYRAQVRAQTDRFNAQTAASEKREGELGLELEGAKQNAESLRDEIETRPVIRQVITKPIGGACPAVATVDWRLFQCAFDAAGAGRPATCPTEPSGDGVRSDPASARY